MPRPFKVWTRDRTVRKAVVAGSLGELISKGMHKLSMDEGEPVMVVLEEDGTQVEDEDYFECLPNNTVFILLRHSEKWLSRKKTEGTDFPDALDGATLSRENELCILLREDFHTIATFSETDLQLLVDMDTTMLAQTLSRSEKFCENLQETCQTYLDDHSRAKEAMQFLQMYHEAETSSDSNKRKRTNLDDK